MLLGKERRKIKEEQKPLENKITDKLFENTRYFVMKSNNFDNIQLAKEKVRIARNSEQK